MNHKGRCEVFLIPETYVACAWRAICYLPNRQQLACSQCSTACCGYEHAAVSDGSLYVTYISMIAIAVRITFRKGNKTHQCCSRC
jgi:hypothetical protein